MVTKETIATKIAEKYGLTKKDGLAIVNDVFDGIVEDVKAGEKVFINDFGTFTKSERSARDGVNPQTKEKIKIEAKTVPHFSASKAFKEAVN